MRGTVSASIRVLLIALLFQAATAALDDPPPPQVALQFDGMSSNYVDIPTSPDFSVGDSGLCNTAPNCARMPHSSASAPKLHAGAFTRRS